VQATSVSKIQSNIHTHLNPPPSRGEERWIPAFAGMTKKETGMTKKRDGLDESNHYILTRYTI